MRADLTALVLTAAVLMTSCGGDGESVADYPDPADAPRGTVTMLKFCNKADRLVEDISGVLEFGEGEPTPEIRDQALALLELGTPRGMSDDARQGWEYMLNRLLGENEVGGLNSTDAETDYFVYRDLDCDVEQDLNKDSRQ